MSILKKLFGTKSDKDLKLIKPIVNLIKEEYEKLQNISNDELRAKTISFKKQIADDLKEKQNQIDSKKAQIEVEKDIDTRETLWKEIDAIEDEKYEQSQVSLNNLLPQAFAVMKETARRFSENEWIEVTATDYDRELSTHSEDVNIEGDKALFHNSWIAGGSRIKWEMIHYDVQLIGGITLHEGKIAEMATGEGKTLVATLPVYLNALTGNGVHIVTVNDYLAKRDAEWMGRLYEFHGLSVDCIDKHQPNSISRRDAYLADVTFGTNNEFGFDYLRDNMCGDPEEMVQRKHNYVIVDEVDSVLIDDARTPLIISGPTPKGDKQEFDDLKPAIQRIYNIQKNLVTKTLAEAKALLRKTGDSEAQKEGGKLLVRAQHGLPKNKALIKFLSEHGMKALMQKTENYYMQNQNKEMYIVDDELYFIIDEKNHSIDLTDKGIVLMNEIMEDENFYHLPDVGAEIADLEKSNQSDSEKHKIKSDLLVRFSIQSERVHTVNQLLRAYTMFEKDVEYVIMENKVKIVDEQTGRIMEGRRYSDGLHQAIEAKENVKVEAATQTYATITLQNYFRMYRKLAGMTGTAITEAGELWDIYKLDVVEIPTNRPITRHDVEDMVYKTKREKYNAVVEEIVKLVNLKRPVLVGTTSVETSELLSKILTRKGVKHNVLNAKLHQREADIVLQAGHAGNVTIATNMAGRGTDIKLSDEVKKAGGLAIIGTERHESRRVDRQLRGRSGRQGDPGSSQFFVSLEDDLMRMFGSERIAKVMDRLGLDDGEVIQHSMITKSIERAQRKIEENNFGIRKRLLEFDDVMNVQRDVIYKRRRHALYGERLAVDISNMIFDVCETLVEEMQGAVDFETFRFEVMKTLAIDVPFDEKVFSDSNSNKLNEALFDAAYKNYKEKIEDIAEKAHPIIVNVHENHSGYENIALPFTDEIKTMNVVANLKKCYDDKSEISLAIEKSITLSYIDTAWKEHLRELDDLKQSVQNATYEQKDPLLIYKFESFELFKKMIMEINKNIASLLIKGKVPLRSNENVKEAEKPRALDKAGIKEERTDLLAQSNSNTQAKKKPEPVRVEKTVGRNEPCPCGSGKKFKHCHGKA